MTGRQNRSSDEPFVASLSQVLRSLNPCSAPCVTLATRSAFELDVGSCAMRHHRFRLLVLGFSALLGYASAWCASARNATPSDAPTEAIWRIQEFDFHFRAERGRYHSCSSLHSKIRGVMEAMGAGSVIVKIACDRSSLVDSTFARIATAMPMQATPENVQAATTFDTEQQMIARLRDTQLPTAETLERFPAEWREITVKKVHGVRLGPEDCDLLHDLHEQVLPHLASIRIVRANFACGNSYLRPARPILVVEALLRRDA
jgi:hypothetical protein